MCERVKILVETVAQRDLGFVQKTMSKIVNWETGFKNFYLFVFTVYYQERFLILTVTFAKLYESFSNCSVTLSFSHTIS